MLFDGIKTGTGKIKCAESAPLHFDEQFARCALVEMHELPIILERQARRRTRHDDPEH